MDTPAWLPWIENVTAAGSPENRNGPLLLMPEATSEVIWAPVMPISELTVSSIADAIGLKTFGLPPWLDHVPTTSILPPLTPSVIEAEGGPSSPNRSPNSVPRM